MFIDLEKCSLPYKTAIENALKNEGTGTISYDNSYSCGDGPGDDALINPPCMVIDAVDLYVE